MSQITKRALETSLKNLLLQKPLNKITISDIAKDCGINRMTFYYHFKDIYDLIEWTCNEETARAINGKKKHMRLGSKVFCKHFKWFWKTNHLLQMYIIQSVKKKSKIIFMQ